MLDQKGGAPFDSTSAAGSTELVRARAIRTQQNQRRASSMECRFPLGVGTLAEHLGGRGSHERKFFMR